MKGSSQSNARQRAAGVILCIAIASASLSQSKSEINYFGQKPPGMVAELFAPGIVSTPLYEHSAPAFSPDGKCVLWAMADGRGYLLESRFENGAWSKPAKPSFIDTAYSYVYPSFSADGKKLLFSSNLKAPVGYRQANGNRIWEVARTENGWGIPVPFDTTASQGQDYAHSMSKNGTLYFSSSMTAGTNWNIRKSEKRNGRYTKPELLPYDINSRDYEDGAYIAPDESFLIFESQRPEGTDGNLSLFICFRDNKGGWTRPLNMGPEINSGRGERFARLSPDGKYLFFGSFRNPAPGSRGADIYWIDARIIEQLRKTAAKSPVIERPLGDEILAALDKRDGNGPVALLENWLRRYPGSMDALVLYSSGLRRQKRCTEAEKLFTGDVATGKPNTGIILEMALIKFCMQDKDGATKLLTPVLEDKMDLRKKYAHLADELFSMGEYALSDEYFDQAIALRPNAISYYNRACAYALAGDKTKAFALLHKAADGGFSARTDYEKDEDLRSLRSDNRWADLEKKLK